MLSKDNAQASSVRYMFKFLFITALLLVLTLASNRYGHCAGVSDAEAKAYLQAGTAAISRYFKSNNDSDYREAKRNLELALENANYSYTAKDQLTFLQRIHHARTSSIIANQGEANNRIEEHVKANDYEGALNILAQACQKDPDQITFSGQYKGYFKKLNRIDEFKTLLRRAIDYNPANYHARDWLAWEFVREGKKEKAYALYEEILSLLPDDHEAIHDFAYAAHMAKDWQKSAELFKKATQINPNLYTNYEYLHECYEQMGDYEAAHSSLLHAIQLAKQFATYKGHIGNLYEKLAIFELKNGKTKASIIYYSEAIEYKERKDTVSLHKSLANIYESEEKIPLAIQEIEKAITISKESGYDTRKLEEDLKRIKKKL